MSPSHSLRILSTVAILLQNLRYRLIDAVLIRESGDLASRS